MPFVVAIILTLLSFSGTKAIIESHTPEVINTVSQPVINKKLTAPEPTSSEPWGKAIKISDHSYRINVKNDDHMASPEEILAALNDLRMRNGVQALKVDPKLCDYTQSRAELFTQIGSTDEHAGFEKFLEQEDGFKKLGYRQLGENSSYGFKMTGVHLIEFVYMQSPDHNKNQLDPKWDHSCVGVSGTATNLIFATSPY